MLESVTHNDVRAVGQLKKSVYLIVATEAHSSKLYHIGMGKSVMRNNLGKANERRNYRIFEDYGKCMIERISLTDKTHIRNLFGKKNINDVKVLYGSSEPNLFNFKLCLFLVNNSIIYNLHNSIYFLYFILINLKVNTKLLAIFDLIIFMTTASKHQLLDNQYLSNKYLVKYCEGLYLIILKLKCQYFFDAVVLNHINNPFYYRII